MYLIPFGDIHRSSPHCHEERWKEFLDWAKKKERAYFLGMGDYDDLISTSERKVFSNIDHESTKETLEQLYRRCTQRLADELSFMKGRLIGLLEGNHYANLLNGCTTTQYLCELLQCRYLGVSSFIRIVLKNTYGNSCKVDVWAHHGLGAARRIGNSINKVEDMAMAADADIYLMGHDHRKSVGMTSRLCLSDAGSGPLHFRDKKLVFARTGSFLKGYVENKPSYVADQALAPTNLGVVKLELTPKRKQWRDGGKSLGKKELDIHCSI